MEKSKPVRRLRLVSDVNGVESFKSVKKTSNNSTFETQKRRMGRPSKLSEVQWEQIGKRLMNKESLSSLAREYKISVPVLSSRFSKKLLIVRDVAQRLVDVDAAVAALAPSDRTLAYSLADDLRAVSSHLATAAKFGSMTAQRLSVIAHAQTDQLDETADISKNIAVLHSVGAFTATANEAAKIGLNLLAANKGATPSPPEMPTRVSLDPVQAALEYQRVMQGN